MPSATRGTFPCGLNPYRPVPRWNKAPHALHGANLPIQTLRQYFLWRLWGWLQVPGCVYLCVHVCVCVFIPVGLQTLGKSLFLDEPF